MRREKISERMRLLQELVPGCNKVFDLFDFGEFFFACRCLSLYSNSDLFFVYRLLERL